MLFLGEHSERFWIFGLEKNLLNPLSLLRCYGILGDRSVERGEGGGGLNYKVLEESKGLFMG